MYSTVVVGSESEIFLDDMEKHDLLDMRAIPRPFWQRMRSVLCVGLLFVVGLLVLTGSSSAVALRFGFPGTPGKGHNGIISFHETRLVNVWQTSQTTGDLLQRKPDVQLVRDNFEEDGPVIMVDNSEIRQELLGFGGAFTEAAALTFHRLNGQLQDRIMNQYFSADGLAYSLGRVHINSCDFSEKSYSFDDHEDDADLQFFDHTVAHDLENSLIPLIRRAQEMSMTRGSPLLLLASPWSPPAWMKSNRNMNGSGSPCVLPEYLPAWADYIAAWISAYENHGAQIWGVTVQNEPSGNWAFESCQYSAAEEAEFLANHLGPTLRRIHPAVKILIFDDSKAGIVEFVNAVMGRAANFVDGAAFHWYSGDYFDNVEEVQKQHADLVLISSEATYDQYGYGFNGVDPYGWGLGYAHDIIGDFNAGAHGWIDWNLLLDSSGGPNHVQNLCKAAMMVDVATQELTLLPQYYFVGHFSKFLPRGSKRLASKVLNNKVGAGPKDHYGMCTAADGLEATSFLRPDEQIIVVVLNCADQELQFKLKIADMVLPSSAPARSIQTYLITGKLAETTADVRQIPCPANSEGDNIASGCSCIAGCRGTISASDTHPFHKGECVPELCPKDSEGQNVAEGCMCKKGFRGSVRPSSAAPFYEGGCHAVPCPENSRGANLPAGCVCEKGFRGTITASDKPPHFSGVCEPVRCPEYSEGSSVAQGCICRAGFQGEVRASEAAPLFYEGECVAAGCPVGSEGVDLPSGCQCRAGFQGTIQATNAFPFYSGSCTPVPCPPNSRGANVATGCTCVEGYSGTIKEVIGAPFFDGFCTAEPCPENSEGVDLPSGCSCKAGFQGSIEPTSSHPFYQGTCDFVPCPAKSIGANIPSGCTCAPGHTGHIVAKIGAPFFEGLCEWVGE